MLIATAFHRGLLFLLFRPLDVPFLSFVHGVVFFALGGRRHVVVYWTVSGLPTS